MIDRRPRPTTQELLRNLVMRNVKYVGRLFFNGLFWRHSSDETPAIDGNEGKMSVSDGKRVTKVTAFGTHLSGNMCVTRPGFQDGSLNALRVTNGAILWDACSAAPFASPRSVVLGRIFHRLEERHQRAILVTHRTMPRASPTVQSFGTHITRTMSVTRPGFGTHSPPRF